MIDEQQIRKIVESVVESVTAPSDGITESVVPTDIPPAPTTQTFAVSPAVGIRGDNGVFDRMQSLRQNELILIFKNSASATVNV